jgi:poly-gamma-glutamate synthesis protein (capsule biosynthesis protein)
MSLYRNLAILCCMIPATLLPPPALAGSITISAVGDIMLAGTARPRLEKTGYGHPFAATREIFADSQVTVGNLEAPIARGGIEFTGKRFRFRTPPAAADAIRRAGFSVVTLANNHILDYGAAGLSETIAHLDAHGIRHTGAGIDLAAARQPCIVESEGTRIAFLAYSLTYPEEFFAGQSRPGTAPGYAAFIEADIKAARRQADYVAVSFHWGKELARQPQPYQVRTARKAVDAGADLVLGHHPHVLQGIERYKNGVIFYSLGNFAFGSRSSHSDRSMIARITLDGGIKEVEIIPLNVLNREVGYQPALLSGEDGKRLIGQLNKLSSGMNSSIVPSGNRFVLAGFPARAQMARR